MEMRMEIVDVGMGHGHGHRHGRLKNDPVRLRGGIPLSLVRTSIGTLSTLRDMAGYRLVGCLVEQR